MHRWISISSADLGAGTIRYVSRMVLTQKMHLLLIYSQQLPGQTIAIRITKTHNWNTDYMSSLIISRSAVLWDWTTQTSNLWTYFAHSQGINARAKCLCTVLLNYYTRWILTVRIHVKQFEILTRLWPGNMSWATILVSTYFCVLRILLRAVSQHTATIEINLEAQKVSMAE